MLSYQEAREIYAKYGILDLEYDEHHFNCTLGSYNDKGLIPKEHLVKTIGVEYYPNYKMSYDLIIHMLEDKGIKPRNFKLYFVINEELNMSQGKIATQVAHCCTEFVLSNHATAEFDLWYNEGKTQTKIMLKGSQKLLEELSKDSIHIRDNGLTEIEAGSLTCVCLGLHEKLEGKLKRLRLL